MSSILLIVLAYFIGSIPTAVWTGRVFFGVDVRQHGSGNAGATNVIRVLGTWVGMAVLLIDMLKGLLAVSLVGFFPALLGPGTNPDLFRVILAFTAVLGHVFPVFAGFRGGKGVATFMGTAFAIFPLTFLCAIGIFLLIFLLTRWVSLGSIVSAFTMPMFAILAFQEPWPSVVFAFVVAIAIPATHHKNIRRLLRGEEKRLEFRKKGIARS
ncbi:MAG TPA: glycerol-3-phosphate 1-O-acyltransferase PlsY [Bacteroidales bacterium]|nr:glycerol-3-phosphate 1-O-acyltransferase PlsY [Bacteroidales bacterium]HRZ76877.1 glycerol-3-phosphate 1-O-acyltransferase PlsY [Bacteroidales bacterium]